MKPIEGSVGEALFEGEKLLRSVGILRPRRHAELLLESVLRLNRTELYLHSIQSLTHHQSTKYNTLLSKRIKGEPVQYLVEWAPFFGRKFIVSQGVFIPRFDTEQIIECVLENIRGKVNRERTFSILDICCGCGVLGVTLAVEIRNSTVTLVDNSPAALEYTTRNAVAHMANNRTKILEWDALTDPLKDWDNNFDIIISNPPYIPVKEIKSLHPDVQMEPHTALTDNSDGLSFYRRWAETIPGLLKRGGTFFVEVGDNASSDVSAIFSESFSKIKTHYDINGQKRVVELSV